MRRQANPHLSSSGERALALYERTLRGQEDLAPASVRNYLSDIRHFMTWYEAHAAEQAADAQDESGFDPQDITIPTLTRYRVYLQTVQKQRPASVNSALMSLKRYFSCAMQTHLITYNPSIAVKLVGQEGTTPRQLDDQEEQSLVAAVTKGGTLRDRVLIVFLLHTGLRAREVCQLRRDQVKLDRRSGFLEVIGKCNKYRELPLNATARKVLEEYLPTLASEIVLLFPSGKTKKALSERALGYIVKNMQFAPNLLM